MSRFGMFAVLAGMTLVAGGCPALATGQAEDPFAPFDPFLGRTWRGVFAGSTPEKPTIDVSRWERALNGQAIRVLHSVNDGEYGGETLIVHDREKQSLVYYYFTTAGFFTQGTAAFEDGKFVSSERVTGNANGITEVRSVGEILPDGRLLSKAEYLRDGEVAGGREVTYAEDPTAQVIFRTGPQRLPSDQKQENVEMEERKKPQPGDIGWHDLTVPNADEIRKFYAEVVGWKSEPVSMGEYDDFSMIGAAGTPAAGICHARGANEGIPPAWMVYITVDDLDRARERCLALGGQVVHGPRSVGSMGRFLVLRDPAGAVAGLWEEAK